MVIRWLSSFETSLSVRPPELSHLQLGKVGVPIFARIFLVSPFTEPYVPHCLPVVQ